MDKKNTIKIVTTLIIVLWVALGVLNFVQTKNLQMPTLAWPGGVAENGEQVTYLGAGFSFIISGDIEEDGSVDNITKMEMYALGFKIATAERE